MGSGWCLNRLEERASSSANKLTSAVQSPDKPLPEDPRELVPAASEGSRVEAMLLQVIEENRLLRSRLDQVERSSWHSGVPEIPESCL